MTKLDFGKLFASLKALDYRKLLSDYGNVLVLLILCVVMSFATVKEQPATSPAAAEELASLVLSENGKGAQVMVLVRGGKKGAGPKFAKNLERSLEEVGLNVVANVQGSPRDSRIALRDHPKDQPLAAVVTDQHIAVFCAEQLPGLAKENPALAQSKRYSPTKHTWPVFLKIDNLRNVLKQIAVVAVIAIGMTLVIITGGIDLSVGSLIAFSAVITALSIDHLGGTDPTTSHLLLGSLAGVVACALIGMGTGGLVTVFKIPAFIVTLGVMFIARGLAFLCLEKPNGLPIGNEEAFKWLGSGADFGLHNSVVLMLILYVLAHIMMSRTSIGRYVYAVGGNPEAARLSGVPVKRVLVFVYLLCGLLAGLGGVMTASLQMSGDPKAGNLVELQVIAAVVVGGTSLAGGKGKIFGTLVGALIIGVIKNGMNLASIEGKKQDVIFGTVILIAVLVDQLKARLR
ncbi:MAG: sugar-transporting ATPase [Opitutae bacterium]|nr:sugar-transporting ATPase [Opitutae bacterium]